MNILLMTFPFIFNTLTRFSLNQHIYNIFLYNDYILISSNRNDLTKCVLLSKRKPMYKIKCAIKYVAISGIIDFVYLTDIKDDLDIGNNYFGCQDIRGSVIRKIFILLKSSEKNILIFHICTFKDYAKGLRIDKNDFFTTLLENYRYNYHIFIGKCCLSRIPFYKDKNFELELTENQCQIKPIQDTLKNIEKTEINYNSPLFISVFTRLIQEEYDFTLFEGRFILEHYNIISSIILKKKYFFKNYDKFSTSYFFFNMVCSDFAREFAQYKLFIDNQTAETLYTILYYMGMSKDIHKSAIFKAFTFYVNNQSKIISVINKMQNLKDSSEINQKKFIIKRNKLQQKLLLYMNYKCEYCTKVQVGSSKCIENNCSGAIMYAWYAAIKDTEDDIRMYYIVYMFYYIIKNQELLQNPFIEKLKKFRAKPKTNNLPLNGKLETICSQDIAINEYITDEADFIEDKVIVNIEYIFNNPIHKNLVTLSVFMNDHFVKKCFISAIKTMLVYKNMSSVSVRGIRKVSESVCTNMEEACFLKYIND